MQHNHAHSHYKNITVKDLENSTKEIHGEIPLESIEELRIAALLNMVKEAELPGFRKGHAPEKLVLEKVGELAVLEDAAEHALSHAYPQIVEELKLNVVGRPRIRLTKLAPGNPVGFVIETAVFPTFDLPDYKNIAKNQKKDDEIAVTDLEVEEVIIHIQSMGKTGETETVLNDETVKKWGPYETVVAFKEAIRTNLKNEKEYRNREKHRLAILEGIINETTIALPPVLIEGELDRMVARTDAEVTRGGSSFSQYLKETNKTEADLRKEWEMDAMKRVKSELVLAAIRNGEKLNPTKEEVAKEVEKLAQHHKDLDIEHASAYVYHTLGNERVFEFLEKMSAK